MDPQQSEDGELKPGDHDYRAFVGPPAQYDVKASTQFALLCALGLREHHNLLDIGCGSLRAGRLFIPYLGTGRYFGIEPERWLVEEGIKENLGQDLVALRHPTFLYRDDFDLAEFGVQFDYVVAQSIFTHSGPDLIRKALHSVAGNLKPDGLLAVNFIECAWPARSSSVPGWHYGGRGIVSYRAAEFRAMANEAGLAAVDIPWGGHPVVKWWLVAREEARLPSLSERRRLTGSTFDYPRTTLSQRMRTGVRLQVRRHLDPPTPERSRLARLTRRVEARLSKRG